MKYFIFLFICCLTVVFQGCNSQKELTEYVSNYRYEYDTITKIFKGNFSKGYRDGIDVIYEGSTLYEACNYCKGDEIKVLDLNNEIVLNLPQYNSECKIIYTSIKKKDVYVVNYDNKIYLYCDGRPEKELVVDMMDIEQFKQSGLTVEWNKPGSDQYIDVPEKVLYFRVNQNYDDSLGKYSDYDAGFPAFAKLNPETNEINFYGETPYFDVYSQYGFISSYFDLYIGDSIIAHTSINGEIEIINTLTNKTIKKEIKSRYDTEPIKKVKYPEDKVDVNNVKFRHYLVSPHYEPLFYNPYTKYYYRIFHPAMDEYNKEGLLNTNQDKKCVLMILNKSFELLDEVLLPVQGNMIVKLYPSKNGVEIYLPEISKKTEIQAEYKHLRINHFKK